jgi:quercetin dioxygenase-like cupin family protein
MITRIDPKFIVTQNNTTLNVFHANTGEGLPQHTHLYSHLTVCTAGRLVIRKENRSLEMTKDTQPVNLVAGEWHEVETLEDGTVFINVFASTENTAGY